MYKINVCRCYCTKYTIILFSYILSDNRENKITAISCITYVNTFYLIPHRWYFRHLLYVYRDVNNNKIPLYALKIRLGEINLWKFFIITNVFKTKIWKYFILILSHPSIHIIIILIILSIFQFQQNFNQKRSTFY